MLLILNHKWKPYQTFSIWYCPTTNVCCQHLFLEMNTCHNLRSLLVECFVMVWRNDWLDRMAFHVEDDEKLGARFRSLPRRGWGAPGLWLVPVLLRRLLPLSTSTSWALLLGGSASAAAPRLLGPGPILAPSRPAPTSPISRPRTSPPSVPRGPATSRLIVRTEHKVYHKCTIIVCMQ